MKNYDIIIVGGGIVGLTLAALLTPQLSIAIVETQPPKIKKMQKKYDLRVSAINLASQEILASAGVWELMQKTRIAPFRGMQVWDAAGDGEINFNCFDMGLPCLGHIIENSVMQSALWQILQQKQIDYIAPAQPQQLIIHDDLAELQLEDGKILTAKLIIGADGANSWVRQQFDIELVTRPYEHTALVTIVATQEPHQQIARQVFLADGILAFLPLLNSNQCSIVWSTTAEKANQLHQLNDEEFNIAINRAFGKQLGEIKKQDQSLIFNLTMRHAKDYVRSRVALVGDAIHTIHPLAGQGLNLGLADAAYLAFVINKNAAKHRDMGHFSTLRRYERARKGPNLLMLNLMAGFKSLFGAKSDELIYLRNFGLNIANKSDLLKKFFMRRATGN